MMIFGRPETFAISVSALGDGPPGERAASAASWTAMRMIVRDRNLFRNNNSHTQTVSETINWPSIHLARWFVDGWNAIFHTPAWPRRTTARNARDVAAALDDRLMEVEDVSDSEIDARDTFVRLHSLRAAAAGAAGAATPDVWFSRDGGVVSVAWNDSTDGATYFPLSRGEDDVPVADFSDAVRGFIKWVHDALVRVNDDAVSSDIALLAHWLGRYSSREGAMTGLLSEVGLRTERISELLSLTGVANASELFALDAAWFEKGTLADVRASAIAVAFRCVSPSIGNDDLKLLRSAILSAPKNEAGFSAIDQLAGRVRRPIDMPDYVRGYQLARGVRDALGDAVGPLDIDKLIDDLRVQTTGLSLGDMTIDGGCVCDELHGPVIFLNLASRRTSAPWSRKLVLAHELCHLLFDRESAASLGIMSGPWAPPRVERVANAFAIELLLPLAGIRATVGDIWHDTQDSHIEELMNKYGIGLTAVTEHVRNMRRRINR